MRRISLVVLILLMSTSAFGQTAVVRGGVGRTAPTVMPMPYYGPSMTAVDRDGNLFIFDVTYSRPPEKLFRPKQLFSKPTAAHATMRARFT